MRFKPVVKVRNLDGVRKRVEVYLPKFIRGAPLIVLGFEYQNREINLITSKSDMLSGDIKINNMKFQAHEIKNINLSRGMRIEYFDSEILDIFIPESVVQG